MRNPRQSCQSCQLTLTLPSDAWRTAFQRPGPSTAGLCQSILIKLCKHCLSLIEIYRVSVCHYSPKHWTTDRRTRSKTELCFVNPIRLLRRPCRTTPATAARPCQAISPVLAGMAQLDSDRPGIGRWGPRLNHAKTRHCGACASCFVLFCFFSSEVTLTNFVGVE